MGDTGRVWRYGRDLQAPGRGERFEGRDEDGAKVLVHRVYSEFVDDVHRMRHSCDIARLPEVVTCTSLRQLVDAGSTPTFEYAVWEWAEESLLDHLQGDRDDRESLAGQVAAAVTRGLDALHAAGWVHCDVAPNNVLEVRCVWKLADFDHCVRTGEQPTGCPKPRYQHPEMAGGRPAEPEWDWYGLARVCDRITDR